MDIIFFIFVLVICPVFLPGVENYLKFPLFWQIEGKWNRRIRFWQKL